MAASGQHRKTPRDMVTMYNAAKVADMLATSGSLTGRSNGRGPTASAAQTSRSTGPAVTQEELLEDARHRRTNRHHLYLKKQLEEQEEERKQLRERVAANARKRDAEFLESLQRLANGREMTDQLDKLLQLTDNTARQKREQMFAEWEAHVFNPICEQINEQLAARGLEQISAKRNEEYAKFLDATNRKEGLFRDIVMESDYDPFVPNRNAVKVDSTSLEDPLKRILIKTLEEKALMQSQAGKARVVSQQRETLDVKQWHTGKIEATPHGFFAKMLGGQPKTADAIARAKKMTDSRVPFDHYHIDTTEETLRQEFPRGKRPEASIRAKLAATQ